LKFNQNKKRRELKNNYHNNNRFEEDRNRTINDYYRMNLDKNSKDQKMTSVYHAYLENTPGSKKALEELLTKNRRNSVEGAPTANTTATEA
jgi:hypothetical protein